MEDSNIRYAVDSFLMLQEKTIRRQWITIILLILITVGSNMAWLYRESQFTDEVVTTQEITQDLDAEGGDAIINDGVHLNGEGTTDGKNDNNQEEGTEDWR